MTPFDFRSAMDAGHDDQLPSVNGMPPNDEPSEFRKLAAAAAITRMFRDRYFDICKLDAAAAALGLARRLEGADYQALRALHCVSWVDMPPGLPRLVREQCVALLALPPQAVDVVPQAADDDQLAVDVVTTQRSGWLGRLGWR